MSLFRTAMLKLRITSLEEEAIILRNLTQYDARTRKIWGTRLSMEGLPDMPSNAELLARLNKTKLGKLYGWSFTVSDHPDDGIVTIECSHPEIDIHVLVHAYYFDLDAIERCCQRVTGLNLDDINWLLTAATNKRKGSNA